LHVYTKINLIKVTYFHIIEIYKESSVTGVVLANASLDVALHDTIQFFVLTSVVLPTCPIIYRNERELTPDYIKVFWVGLMDGDGSIQVNHWRHKSLQFRLVIKMANQPGNVYMLKLISNTIGGYVSYPKSNGVTSVVWKIDDRKIIQSIISIFEQYPPLTSRLTCQLSFLKECLAHNSVERYLQSRDNKFLAQHDIIQKFNSSFTVPYYFNAWLSGFVEAEGCFALRTTGYPSFSIGQNNDLYLLNTINQHFGGINKVINKSKLFYLLEVYRKSVLRTIGAHFVNYPLLGHKYVSYNKWLAVIS
jgi:hypothetical protein